MARKVIGPTGSRRRRWLFLLCLVSAATAAVIYVTGAFAVVSGSPSGFESNDGNMTLGATGGSNTDWNCFAGVGNTGGFSTAVSSPAGCKVTTGAAQVTADQNGEISWVPGQKFDTQCPALSVNNNPPKDEFTNVASFGDTATNLDEYFYGATIRPNVNGNVSGDVELNQSSGNGTTSAGCRSSGDRLIAYDFLNGGTSLNFHVLTWITSLTDTSGGNNTGGTTGCLVAKAPPCWGAKVIIPDSSAFDGEANQSIINAADNGMNHTQLAVNAFAEFGINLSLALGLRGQCIAFPQQVWESRSSGSSFTSNPQDIEISNTQIQNCGTITIIKHTSPRGLNQSFNFHQDVTTAGDFTLNDNGCSVASCTGNTKTFTNVLQSTYHVSEDTVPSGYSLDSVSCTSTGGSSTTSGTSDSSHNGLKNLILTGGGSITCTYVNSQNSATLATQQSATGSVFPGTGVTDTATVTGSNTSLNPGGTVTFYLCGPLQSASGCSSSDNTRVPAGSGTLSGTGGVSTATSSPAVNGSGSALAAGIYCFEATWPGDSNYPGSKDVTSATNECFTVSQIGTTTTTTPSVGSGGSTTFGNTAVTDHAVVQAAQTGDGTPTGTVAFTLCSPSDLAAANGGQGEASCITGGTQVGSAVTLGSALGDSPPDAAADSVAFSNGGNGVNQLGTWCWRAVFTPSGANANNYTGSSDTSTGECFTVNDTFSNSSSQTWVPNDSATVTAGHGAPLNGTLKIQLYTSGDCSTGAVSTQIYTKTLNDATTLASRTVTSNNTAFTVSTSTSVSWLVTFTSTDSHVTGTTHCESTSLTITN